MFNTYAAYFAIAVANELASFLVFLRLPWVVDPLCFPGRAKPCTAITLHWLEAGRGGEEPPPNFTQRL